jgi:hypothetical protein
MLRCLRSLAFGDRGIEAPRPLTPPCWGILAVDERPAHPFSANGGVSLPHLQQFPASDWAHVRQLGSYMVGASRKADPSLRLPQNRLRRFRGPKRAPFRLTRHRRCDLFWTTGGPSLLFVCECGFGGWRQTLRTVTRDFAAPPTGRENLLGVLSQDGASLCPGLFSFLPSGKTAAMAPASAQLRPRASQ